MTAWEPTSKTIAKTICEEKLKSTLSLQTARSLLVETSAMAMRTNTFHGWTGRMPVGWTGITSAWLSKLSHAPMSRLAQCDGWSRTRLGGAGKAPLEQPEVVCATIHGLRVTPPSPKIAVRGRRTDGEARREVVERPQERHMNGELT